MKIRNISDSELRMHELRLAYVEALSKFESMDVTEAFKIADHMLDRHTVDTTTVSSGESGMPTEHIQIKKAPSKSPTQQVTPEFEDMVDPNFKASDTTPKQEDLTVSAELQSARTAQGTIPMRYEDRVKYAESNPHPTTEINERPSDSKVDVRGFGESGGDYPPQQ